MMRPAGLLGATLGIVLVFSGFALYSKVEQTTESHAYLSTGAIPYLIAVSIAAFSFFSYMAIRFISPFHEWVNWLERDQIIKGKFSTKLFSFFVAVLIGGAPSIALFRYLDIAFRKPTGQLEFKVERIHEFKPKFGAKQSCIQFSSGDEVCRPSYKFSDPPKIGSALKFESSAGLLGTSIIDLSGQSFWISLPTD